MVRYPGLPQVTERLMTVEEAERLSRLDGSHEADSRDARSRRAPGLWAWANVDSVLAGTVSDEQIDRVVRARKR